MVEVFHGEVIGNINYKEVANGQPLSFKLTFKYLTMFYKIFLVITIGITIISCNNKKIPKNPINHFSKSEFVICKNAIDISEYDILFPTTILKYKNWYVFDEINDNNACIKMLKTDLSKSIKGVQQGNGPFDVIGYFKVDKTTDSLYIIDSNHKRIFNLDVISDSLKLKVIKEDISLNGTGIMLNKNLFLEPTLGDSLMYRLIDLDKNVLAKIFYPQNVCLSKFDYMAQNSIYLNTKFACSPDRTHYAWGILNYSLFGFGTIIKNKSLTLDKMYEYQPIKIRDLVYHNESWHIAPTRDNPIVTIDCIGTEKYAIFLYYGKPYNGETPTSSDLLIYEWGGKPYKHVKLDKQMLIIQYDAEQKLLYGLAYEPEATLVEYDMNTILK